MLMQTVSKVGFKFCGGKLKEHKQLRLNGRILICFSGCKEHDLVQITLATKEKFFSNKFEWRHIPCNPQLADLLKRMYKWHNIVQKSCLGC